MRQQDTSELGTTLNGPAAAAFLAAGIGSFTMALLVMLGRFGIFSAPTLYNPVGGLSGKMAITIAVWLVAWGALHFRWNKRDVNLGPIIIAALGLVVLGVLGTSLPFLG